MMAVPSGTKLGPYEIQSQLGAGGMGEVYRARDTRLGRDVAIKILPQSFARDTDRLRRFEQEARAAAALNHPNLLAVHDLGTYRATVTSGTAAITAVQECPYIVGELLEGETLRTRLHSGAMPARKAIDCARQIAHGLAAAHDKGIVHRDLKPENIFITEDGRVKILDFGLAKLTRPEPGGEGLTQTVDSDPGSILGTVGYMSPEQVRGKATDARSDLFSFGVILYEMLTGKRAFQRDSAAETMSAILKEEPPDLTEMNRAAPPALERVVRHCLEKNPTERFQSARDIAFDLEVVSTASSSRVRPVSSRFRLRRLAPLLWTFALIAVAALGYVIGKGRTAAPPQFKALTYERGSIPNARFAPDGQSVVYDASWDGKPVRIFSTPASTAQPRALELEQAHLLSLSPSGEVAVGLGGSLGNHLDVRWTTLGRAPLAGGAPRQILDNVAEADWAPDGNLAIVHIVNGHDRIEFPIGHVLYETSGWITGLRLSPKGDRIAFLEHPTWPDDRGWVAVVDSAGHKAKLTQEYESINGLAWAPGGEIWFAGTLGNDYRSLRAVGLGGHERVVLSVPGGVRLYDIAPDGRVLLSVDNEKVGIKGAAAGEKERDLSWSGWTLADDISPDGKWLLFNEQSVIAGSNYIVGIRTLAGSVPVRLGEGIGGRYSVDGQWVTSAPVSGPPRLQLFPTGIGTLKEVPLPLERVGYGGALLGDGKHLMVIGAERGHAFRCYVFDLNTSKLQAVTPEGKTDCAPLPDGSALVAPGDHGQLTMYPVAGGAPRDIPGNTAGMLPIRFGSRGELYASRAHELPVRILRIDLTSGRQDVIRELAPTDEAGLIGISPVALSPDAKAYAYSYRRTLSDLYVVSGLK